MTSIETFIFVSAVLVLAYLAFATLFTIVGLLRRRDRLYEAARAEYLEQKERVESRLKEDRKRE